MRTTLQGGALRLPSRIEVRSEMRMLGFMRRTRNEFLYSGFKETPAVGR